MSESKRVIESGMKNSGREKRLGQSEKRTGSCYDPVFNKRRKKM